MLPDPIHPQHTTKSFKFSSKAEEEQIVWVWERTGEDRAVCCSASSWLWERLGGNTNQLKEQGTAACSCQVASLAVLFHIYQSCGDCCWSRRDWERTLGDDDLMLESSIMSRAWKRISMEVVVFLWDFLGKHVVKQSARANAGTEVPVCLFLLGEEKKKKRLCERPWAAVWVPCLLEMCWSSLPPSSHLGSHLAIHLEMW